MDRFLRAPPRGGANSADRSVLLQDSDMRVYGNDSDVVRKPHFTPGRQRVSKVRFYQDLRQLTTPKSTFGADQLTVDKN